ncbi:MAG: pyridoxal phosphate-dependent aminotransferase [Gammaproteobacteria bacterium]|nr:pyridoxal phosphate-dependent aminotransferase [Gammaproteobacteria bacterium]
MHLASKLPQVGTTIFSVMSALANEHRALNLAQGFPDFSCPERLMQLVTEHMQAGRNQYAPMTGVLALREAIAEKTLTCYGALVDVEREITVTSGATEALFAAIMAVVRAGDEVIVFDPAYDSYAPAVELAGGQCRHIGLNPPDYAIDWQAVRDAITPRTRLIIINSPHNPTGSVLGAADITILAELTRGSGILVLSDEVYEHIIFDGQEHASVLRHEELRARSFVISSFGKTYHTTGWKLGYCIAPAALSAEFRKVHQYLTFSTCTPMQYAVADFIAECPEHYQELPQFYQAKRDSFLEGLVGSGFKPLPCKGTYFQLLDYSAVSDERDLDFARRLTIEHGLAAIPVSVFFADGRDDKVLRFCFAKSEATLREGTKILCSI